MFSNKELRKLIIPLVIEQFLVISLGMIDTVMVSAVGEAAVSGVSIVDMLNVLVIDVFAGLATGGAVVVSHYLGAKNKEVASKTGSQLISVCALFGAAVFIIVMVFRTQIMNLLFGRIEKDVMDSAMIYLTITSISFPFISVYNGAAALFRTMGNSRISMISSLVINVVNIAGNALFIFVFRMGVTGAALSTLIARFIAMWYLLFRLERPGQDVVISMREMAPKLSTVKKILKIGIPASAESSMFQLGRVIVVTLIATFGTAQIAANAMANNLDAFGCIAGKGFQLAVITVIGQCVGAGRNDEAVRYSKKMMKWVYIVATASNGIVLATLPLSSRLYNISDEARSLGIILVLIHAGCALFLWPSSFVLPQCLKAGGDANFTMIVSVSSMWVFRILLSYLIGMYLGLGAIGVWIAMVVDWIFRATMFITRFHSRKWLHKSLAESE